MKMETQNRGLKSYLFGDKAFYKAVFAIVVPIIIQNLITSFVSLLDNVMVGVCGECAGRREEDQNGADSAE